MSLEEAVSASATHGVLFQERVLPGNYGGRAPLSHLEEPFHEMGNSLSFHTIAGGCSRKICVRSGVWECGTVFSQLELS